MAPYKTIHTNYGLSAMAAAEASGVPINLTHMAAGDPYWVHDRKH